MVKKQEKDIRDNAIEKKKTYSKPAVESEVYMEKGALACNKIAGTTAKCKVNAGVS